MANDPFSTFTQGFQDSYKMGLLQRQQTAAELADVEKKKEELEAKKFNQGIQLLDTGAKYRKFGPAYQAHAMTLIKKGGELLGMPMPENMPTYQQEFDEIGNEIELAIKGFKQFGDKETLQKALTGSYNKATSLLEANELKSLKEDVGTRVEDISKGQESGMLQQAAMMPGLARGNEPVLTPEQAETGRLTALAGGGTKGQDVLAKGMAEGKDKDHTQTANFAGKDGKVHVWQYNADTNTYDKDLGLASSTSDGRGTYADTQILNRIVDKFNADPTVRQVEKMDEFANIIGEVAISDNPIGHASLETLMARASGEVGNLSEADKKPFGGSRALTEKTKQYFLEIYSGKKTPENIAFIQKLAETFRQAGVKKKISMARERSKQYEAAHRGKFSAKEIFDALAPDGGGYVDKTVTRTGIDRKTGKKVIQYSDGSTEYGN